MMNPTHLCLSVTAVVAAGLLSACDPVGPDTDRVRVRAAFDMLHVSNGALRPVFFTAFDARDVAAINWAACVDAERCPPLAPGETRSGPYEEMIGLYDAETTSAIVYWWHAVRGPDGALKPDSIRDRKSVV